MYVRSVPWSQWASVTSSGHTGASRRRWRSLTALSGTWMVNGFGSIFSLLVDFGELDVRMPGRSGEADPDRHRFPGPQGVVEVAFRRSADFDGLHPLGQRGEECRSLQPGDVLAHALMDTHSESQVSRGVP